jgi:hypothetical protein
LTDQLAFLKLDKLRVAGDAGVVDEGIDASYFAATSSIQPALPAG